MINTGIKLQQRLEDCIRSALKFGELSAADSRILNKALLDRYISALGLKILKHTRKEAGADFMSLIIGSKLVFPNYEVQLKKVKPVLSTNLVIIAV